MSDKEDIESLGFLGYYKDKEGLWFSNGQKLSLCSNSEESENIVLFNSESGKTLFNGTIKNKSELKQVLKQIGHER